MTKNQNRRMIITLVVMVAVALAGLTMIQVDPVSADKAIAANAANTPAASDPGAMTGSEDGVTYQADSGVYGAVAKMLSALVLVVVLVYGALYALRRMMGKRFGGKTATGSLEVLQTTHVGPHKTISLVRVGRRSVLVGVTDSQISTLTELDAAETEELVGVVETDQRSESFANILSTTGDKLKAIGLGKKRAALET